MFGIHGKHKTKARGDASSVAVEAEETVAPVEAAPESSVGQAAEAHIEPQAPSNDVASLGTGSSAASGSVVQADSQQQAELARLQAENEQLRRELEDLRKQAERYDKEQDNGWQLLLGFKRVTPYLRSIIGRGFVMAISYRFDYRNDSDIDQLNETRDRAAQNIPDYHNFRDTYKEGYGFRLLYALYNTKKTFYQTLPDGSKILSQDYMMPATMQNGGLEIGSDHKTAMYQVIRTAKPQNVAVPEHVLGIPLYSQAFPVFDDQGELIGGISFAVEIDAILGMASELQNIESRDEDARLNSLAEVLRKELEASGMVAADVKQESILSQKTAQKIREKGMRVIDIAEQLNVLAINTAIEASKVGESGRGVGVIAGKMKEISNFTQHALKEIYDESTVLDSAAQKVINHSDGLVAGSGRLKDELSVLSEVSGAITTQKDELAQLVRSSIEGLTSSKEDLNAIYGLLDKD